MQCGVCRCWHCEERAEDVAVKRQTQWWYMQTQTQTRTRMLKTARLREGKHTQSVAGCGTCDMIGRVAVVAVWIVTLKGVESECSAQCAAVHNALQSLQRQQAFAPQAKTAGSWPSIFSFSSAHPPSRNRGFLPLHPSQKQHSRSLRAFSHSRLLLAMPPWRWIVALWHYGVRHPSETHVAVQQSKKSTHSLLFIAKEAMHVSVRNVCVCSGAQRVGWW